MFCRIKNGGKSLWIDLVDNYFKKYQTIIFLYLWLNFRGAARLRSYPSYLMQIMLPKGKVANGFMRPFLKFQ